MCSSDLKTRIEQFIFSDTEIEEYLKSSSKEENRKNEEIEFAIREIEKLQNKMDRLIELNINGEDRKSVV